MYMLVNGREVTEAQIREAFAENKAAIIDNNGTAALILHVEPLDFDRLYYRLGKKVAIQKPSSVQAALDAAYF